MSLSIGLTIYSAQLKSVIKGSIPLGLVTEGLLRRCSSTTISLCMSPVTSQYLPSQGKEWKYGRWFLKRPGPKSREATIICNMDYHHRFFRLLAKPRVSIWTLTPNNGDYYGCKCLRQRKMHFRSLLPQKKTIH